MALGGGQVALVLDLLRGHTSLLSGAKKKNLANLKGGEAWRRLREPVRERRAGQVKGRA